MPTVKKKPIAEAPPLFSETLKLGNVVQRSEDKQYLSEVRLTLGGWLFELRQVHLRFADGPSLDLTLTDMDNLVIAYGRLRRQLQDEHARLRAAKKK